MTGPTCSSCGADLGTGVSWLGTGEVYECPNGCDRTPVCDVHPCEMAPDHAGPHVFYAHLLPGDTTPVRVEW
jgi:hypothetical protein